MCCYLGNVPQVFLFWGKHPQVCCDLGSVPQAFFPWKNTSLELWTCKSATITKTSVLVIGLSGTLAASRLVAKVETAYFLFV